jgi:hypothetical protein
MEPITIITAATTLLSVLKGSNSVGFGDAELLQSIIGEISNLFARGKRTCVHKTHECIYREGSCHVLLTKKTNWQIDDITNCPYRKEIQ